ncbi:MAG: DoxX [Bacteroidetes bacterium ADurb.Bin037]|mgnify:CR=1 FL=1|nr:MAG: DoxX [Bacteroidetes bacterium ADurb.Bin037]HPW78625.1 DoxX family protein [Bacteroidales bacterium]HQB56032.1 DoxX family protein [Bacteroidales bacterium]
MKRSIDFALLLFRVLIASLMLYHGLTKLLHYENLKTAFPDPLGIGGNISLILILFAEIGCSILIIAGLLTRLATIPIIFAMAVAAFIIHAGDPFAVREPALLNMGLFTVLLISGAGSFSIDYYLFGKKKLFSRK